MWSVDIVQLIWLPVENGTSYSGTFYEVVSILYIIQFIYDESSIYNVKSNPPNFDVFVIWYWRMP